MTYFPCQMKCSFSTELSECVMHLSYLQSLTHFLQLEQSCQKGQLSFPVLHKVGNSDISVRLKFENKMEIFALCQL